MSKILNKIGDVFLELLFPLICVGCGTFLVKKAGKSAFFHQEQERENQICKACLKTIKPKSSSACAFCQSPAVAGRTCQFCLRDHWLDRLLAVVSYEQPLVEKIIKTIKYRFVKTLSQDIAALMTKYVRRKIAGWSFLNQPVILVTAVPLTKRRFNWRGFNQSEIIAANLAKNFGWPQSFSILRRIRNQKPQADIKNRQSRIQNAINVFKCALPEEAAGKQILIIDDVAATGSTLNDCARALKAAGAKEVIGLVFARGK